MIIICVLCTVHLLVLCALRYKELLYHLHELSASEGWIGLSYILSATSYQHSNKVILQIWRNTISTLNCISYYYLPTKLTEINQRYSNFIQQYKYGTNAKQRSLPLHWRHKCILRAEIFIFVKFVVFCFVISCGFWAYRLQDKTASQNRAPKSMLHVPQIG
jgi:hypothetical protein